MALTIKRLNDEASFLLTFEPIEAETVPASFSEPFRILLDPCLSQSARRAGPALGCCTGDEQASCAVQDLPEVDLIIISNSRSDHCHEATLRNFAPDKPRPIIFAESSAAKMIQSWRHFKDGKVSSLRKWQDPRQTGQNNVVRVPIPAKVIAGDEGLVTISFIPQKRDKRGLRSAIGITYRPASSGRSVSLRPLSTFLDTPPVSPSESRSQRAKFAAPAALNTPSLPPLPSFTPLTPPASPKPRLIRTTRSLAALSPHAKDRAVSVIFAPNGVPYTGIESYATSHLLIEAALPLTALLHSFDTVTRPWWLGGDVASGFEDGHEIVAKLGARVWIDTCKGEKDAQGLTKRFTRHKKHNQDEMRRMVQDVVTVGHKPGSPRSTKANRPTEVLSLNSREEITLTSEGVWAAVNPSPKDKARPSIRIVPTDAPSPSSETSNFDCIRTTARAA
ncbi:hypothetical protein AAL_00003 [Moelleriella libera RCEF 2490]|uniref:Uncharacterized protein n=1 Tax=Moelleriella libera RCEF 2490 TaxID=1081109 RepID=A0A166UHC7_9HYPO|nr:hypothetical protein AAL_00003 [Moelleriella libera RCEF 2490]